MIVFQYAPEIVARFPTVRGGVILARGLHNEPTPSALLRAYQAEQRATLERIGDTPLAQLPSLAAWRRVFSAFGVPPTKYRNAAEALLRRLTKKSNIPSLNLLVDLGNLVSIRYGLPVAFVDRRAIQGTLTVRFARGDERFTDLGTSEAVHPAAGEVIFADEADVVFARRWCWRQSAQSAAREDTREALITVEAHHETGEDDVRRALDDLRALLAEYVPDATLSAEVLSSQRPAFVLPD